MLDYCSVLPTAFKPYAEKHFPIILDECKVQGLSDPQVCYVLATAWGESGCGKYMEEIWGPSDYQRNYEFPSQTAKFLGNTAKGDGYKYRGRGYVQITGYRNYNDWNTRLKVNLVDEPNLACKPEYAAKILVLGMKLGTFTGRNLEDFINSEKTDFYHARNIINGNFIINNKNAATEYAEFANAFFNLR